MTSVLPILQQFSSNKMNDDGNSNIRTNSACSDGQEVPLLQERRMRGRKLHTLLFVLLLLVLFAGLLSYIWLTVEENEENYYPDTPFQLVDRGTWNAMPATGRMITHSNPATRVVIIHTVSEPCLELAICCEKVREIQMLHIRNFSFSDIGYSFLIGGDGRTYEGRGWDERGAFARLLNSNAIGIAFIGDFEYNAPTKAQISQCKSLLKEAIRRKKLSQDYKLVGHRQVSDTLSPGQVLFDVIRKWPHWEQCYKETC